MANVDQNELDKFSALADSWWDLDGDSRALHDLNPCRGQFVADRAILAGMKVLDVGCGGGILTEFLARAGADVTGIDANQDLIQVAQQHARNAGLNITYECTTLEAFSSSDDGGYNVITCMELLEHVPDPPQLVKACASRLRHGGNIFFSTINRTPKAYALGIIGAEYILKLLPKGTHDYDRFIRPSELAQWGRKAGLATREVCGMRYNPLSRRARLQKDVSVNYIAQLAPTA